MNAFGSLKLGGALLGLAVAFPALAGTALPGPVVDAAWLKAHLAEVTVLDVRDDMATFTTAPEFEADKKTGKDKLTTPGGRIAGSRPVDFAAIRVSRDVDGKKIDKLLPDRTAFQAAMQAAGLSAGKPIVISSLGDDAGQVEEATRLYWTLKVYGEDQLAVLDGGIAAWIEAGNPITTEAASPATGDWQAGETRNSLIAAAADVEAAARDKVQLVDARPLPQYLGLFYKKPSVAAGGHVAGSKNVPTDVRFRAAGAAQVFLSPDEYRYVMKAQGVDPGAPSITYCNTGHMASGLWFIQSEILGNRKVSLYDGSMHEWTTLGKPVVGVGG